MTLLGLHGKHSKYLKMYFYINSTENRIQAIYNKSYKDSIVVEGCDEIILPDDFDYMIVENDRKREMSASELLCSISYYEQRNVNYPSLSDQFDMLWHSMDENESLRIEPFYSTIKAVKDKYPKPSELLQN